MKVHDQVIIAGMEGRISKILPDGKLEVTLVTVVDSLKGPTNKVIVRPVVIYCICEFK